MVKHHFNNLKLRNKLLILYVFSVFLPIVLTNIIFYNVTTTNVRNQKMNDKSLVVKQMKNDFLETVEHAIGISAAMYTDNNINEFLDKKYDKAYEYIEAYDLTLRGFNKYSPVFSSIKSITFYIDNPTVLYSGGVNSITDQVKQQQWYQVISKKEKSLPIFLKDENDNFSIIRELNFYWVYNNVNKIVKIDLDEQAINSIFDNVNLQGHVYLLNEKGMIEYSTNPDVQWRTDSISFESITLPEEASLIEETYHIDNYLNNWKIIGVLTEEDLLEDVQQSRLFIFYLACFNFLVPTAIIVLISQSINLRLNRVLRHMKKMKNQTFETIEGIHYRDEIGQLSSEFNRMSKRIDELINDVYIANIQKKDLDLQRKQAQLSALQSQINPHFLFNALETIRMRSIIKKENETAKIIQNMAKMLRKSFTWGKDWVTVHEEIAIILCFLEIQKYRFGDKLEYRINIDDSAGECVIPNMALLPFVENASIHGIEPKKGKGCITINIKLVNEVLQCEIHDNGPGIPKEKLAKMLESLKTEEAIGENVGIKNVYYRLKMYFGSDFHFDIKSNQGEGTTVSVYLPYPESNKSY